MYKIEQLLELHPMYEATYLHNVGRGQQHLKGKRVAFSMLTRNSELRIDNNIRRLIKMVDPYVEDYVFIIYENDSTDNTKHVIEKLAIEFEGKIFAKMENLDREMFGPVKTKARTEALAEYRNTNGSLIKSNFQDFDYVIVCDSDFIDFSEKGVYNSFGLLSVNPHIHAICGNSFQLKFTNQGPLLWNYDSWAFRDTWWHDIALIPNEFIEDPMRWFGLWFPPVGSVPKVINSGFGGMCIYKIEQYLMGKYSGEDCEHVLFHWNIKSRYKDFTLALNPSQIMLMP
jgi:glycosyltransferase involved in cell wall biosynthesis